MWEARRLGDYNESYRKRINKWHVVKFGETTKKTSLYFLHDWNINWMTEGHVSCVKDIATPNK